MNTDQLKLASDLLAQTQAHYNSSNRSQDGKYGCCYALEGRRCAIGRIMTRDGLEKIARSAMNNRSLMEIMKTFGPDVIQEQWRPLFATEEGIRFGSHVQKLHDTNGNWNESGLTTRGRDHMLMIKRSFSIIDQ